MSTVPCGTRICRKKIILPFVQGLDLDRHSVPYPNSKFADVRTQHKFFRVSIKLGIFYYVIFAQCQI
jgi:hypothetical protein